MSTVQIADEVGATIDLQIRDDCPLAKAKPTQLVSAIQSFVASFTEPVDKCQISHLTLGGSFTSLNLISDGTLDLKISGGVNCELVVLTPSDKLLFADDGFSPKITIENDQCWIGFEVDAVLGAKLSASADGFGLDVQGSTKVVLTTFTLLEASLHPLPVLKDAVVAALEHFSISTTPAAIRLQEAGTVNVGDLAGSISVTGSYSLPVSLNAFASANLPFNLKMSVSPTATVCVKGSLTLTGDFLVRSQKLTPNVLHFGAYKKKGSTLSATLTAEAGVGIESGSTELLGAVLNFILPGVDVSKSGLPVQTAKELNGVIKESLDRSISIGMNASCSAAESDEAAVLYEISLDEGDTAKTDYALRAALKGNWTDLDTLQNARCLRNIIVETKERKQKVAINLLGFYSATSIENYIAKLTILRDNSGQLAIVDRLGATRIQAASTPYAADPDKLRIALAQDFIATASYAVIGSKLNLGLSIVQDYLQYAEKMSRQQMRDNVLLGIALNLIPAGTFDELLAQNSVFPHAMVHASIRYDGQAVMSIFFSDPKLRTARSRTELEHVGRSAMLALLDPTETGNYARIATLSADSAWSAMDEIGNVTAFSTIPELSGFNATELAAVGADWVSISWWVDSISKVAPILNETLAAIEVATGADPTKDTGFMAKRDALAAILGSVARNTKAAFDSDWGPAVIFALSGRHGSAEMDIGCANGLKHYES